MVPDCPRCGLHFEREQGYWTGAVAMNTIIIGGLFAIVLVTAMILTVPDIPWVTVLVLVIPLMAIGPLILYPFSKTLWVAIDLAFLHPLGITPGAGRPSSVSTPSSNVHWASPTIAKSWKSSCACSMNC